MNNNDMNLNLNLSKLCSDQQLQLSKYLYDNYYLSWFRLIEINKNFYPYALYILRKYRLTMNELDLLVKIMSSKHNYIDYKLFQSAVTNQYLKVIQYVIANNLRSSSIDGIRNEYNLAFQKAVGDGQLKIIKCLINKIQFKYEYDEAIKLAVKNGYLRIVKYLIKQYPERFDKTMTLNLDRILHNAIDDTFNNNKLKTIKYLIRLGADVGIAFKNAAKFNNLKLLKYLAEYILKNQDISKLDLKSVISDAFSYAVENNNLDMVTYIADHSLFSPFLLYNIEYKFSTAVKNGNIDMANYFMDKYSFLMYVNLDKLLENVTMKGNLNAVKYVIGLGANINSNHYNIIGVAAENGHLEVVKYLIENNANVNFNKSYALRNAAKSGHLVVVKYLVEHGASIHAKNDQALQYAAENGKLEVVKYLVDMGANIHAKNDLAIKLAKGYWNSHTANYLISKTDNPYKYL